MVRCQCRKRDSNQCTRKGSRRTEHNASLCWQHQKCKKTISDVDIKAQRKQGTELKKGAELKQGAELIAELKKQSKSVEKLALKPFIQQSDQMVAFDPNNGKDIISDENEATVLNGVVKGLWEITLSVVKDEEKQFSHLTQFEAHLTKTNISLCEWEYEGVANTEQGWFGLFDHKAIEKMEVSDVIDKTEHANYFKFGVYLDVGLAGQFEVDVCYDTKGQIIGVKVDFLKGLKRRARKAKYLKK